MDAARRNPRAVRAGMDAQPYFSGAPTAPRPSATRPGTRLATWRRLPGWRTGRRSTACPGLCGTSSRRGGILLPSEPGARLAARCRGPSKRSSTPSASWDPRVVGRERRGVSAPKRPGSAVEGRAVVGAVLVVCGGGFREPDPCWCASGKGTLSCWNRRSACRFQSGIRCRLTDWSAGFGGRERLPGGRPAGPGKSEPGACERRSRAWEAVVGAAAGSVPGRRGLAADSKLCNAGLACRLVLAAGLRSGEYGRA